MEKYLVTIRFTYNDAPKDEFEGVCKSKPITIGLYDTQSDAITNGNKALEKFEKYFPLNPNWNVKERFSNNGGPFGEPVYLITNTAWIITPFALSANITVLDYQDVEETINNVIDAQKRYKKYKDNLKINDYENE